MCDYFLFIIDSNIVNFPDIISTLYQLYIYVIGILMTSWKNSGRFQNNSKPIERKSQVMLITDDRIKINVGTSIIFNETTVKVLVVALWYRSATAENQMPKLIIHIKGH